MGSSNYKTWRADVEEKVIFVFFVGLTRNMTI